MCIQDKISLKQRLFAKFMANQEELSYEYYKEKKKELFSGLFGQVLEVGPGTGVNLGFYPKEIKWVGIEPNQAMHHYLRDNAKEHGIEVELFEGITEEFEIKDNFFDFVVCTLVLCSVSSVSFLLREIHRVLKPGGKFLFIEHVVDNTNTFRRLIQKTVPFTPWLYFSDGCHPGRDTAKYIEEAGFSKINYQSYLQDGKGIIIWVNKPHIYGYAIK